MINTATEDTVTEQIITDVPTEAKKRTLGILFDSKSGFETKLKYVSDLMVRLTEKLPDTKFTYRLLLENDPILTSDTKVIKSENLTIFLY